MIVLHDGNVRALTPARRDDLVVWLARNGIDPTAVCADARILYDPDRQVVITTRRVRDQSRRILIGPRRRRTRRVVVATPVDAPLEVPA